MRPQLGITLIELLIGVALMGTLLALSVPAFDGLIEETKADTVTNRLRTEMAFARSEAVFRRRQVVICRSADGFTCTHAGPWSAGTLTFEDRDRDQIRDPHESILRSMGAADYAGMHLVDVGRRYHVAFRADGRSAGTNITLKLCSRDMDPRRLLVINVGGRVRVAKPGPDFPRCGE